MPDNRRELIKYRLESARERYTTDFDVGFISSKYLASSVVIVDNKGFDTHSGGFAVVSNALV